jgi:hypothetical protein
VAVEMGEDSKYKLCLVSDGALGEKSSRSNTGRAAQKTGNRTLRVGGGV